MRAGASSAPEVYPRPDGTVYMCGGGSGGLPDDPASITAQQPYVEKILVRMLLASGLQGSLAACNQRPEPLTAFDSGSCDEGSGF